VSNNTRSVGIKFTGRVYCSSSPGVVIANTSSVGASLSVWVAAGILAWTGARYAHRHHCKLTSVHVALYTVPLRNLEQ
jgi:hypothetical protein